LGASKRGVLQEAEGNSGEGSSAGMSQQLDFLMSSMRSKIQNAVSEMQAQLQEELQEEELKIYHVLGQGAFGTVYHGANCLHYCHGFNCQSLIHMFPSQFWNSIVVPSSCL
jgi:hypothetical protein